VSTKEKHTLLAIYLGAAFNGITYKLPLSVHPP